MIIDYQLVRIHILHSLWNNNRLSPSDNRLLHVVGPKNFKN